MEHQNDTDEPGYPVRIASSTIAAYRYALLVGPFGGRANGLRAVPDFDGVPHCRLQPVRLWHIPGAHAVVTVPDRAPSTSFSLTTTTETPAPPIFGATPSSPAGFFGSPIGAACAPGDLALAWGGQVSEATGQHSLGLVLTNSSNVTCHLIGYPGISLIDSAAAALPLAYRHGGDQMVTSSAPKNVNLPPRSAAYVLINQYRCDLGDKDTAAILRFIPPNTTSPRPRSNSDSIRSTVR